MIKPSKAKTVKEYIDLIEEPRKSDIQALHNLILKTAPKLKIVMYGNIVGYGPYHYKYPSGREGEWFTLGLASQKNYISLYACSMVNGEYVAEKYKKDLPKANIGKSCVRFRKLSDVDLGVIKKLIIETSKSGPFYQKP